MQTVLLGDKFWIFFGGMFDESELDHLFKEEMDNLRREVISYRSILIYFIWLLWFYRFLAEYLKSFFFWINIRFSMSNSDWQIAFIWSCVSSFINNLAGLLLVQMYMSFNIISLSIFSGLLPGWIQVFTVQQSMRIKRSSFTSYELSTSCYQYNRNTHFRKMHNKNAIFTSQDKYSVQ